MVVHIDPTPFNRVCPRCQANVHGPNTQTCPECGGSMVPACRGCGYDLAGLSRDSVCPECGTPVERSYQPDLLCNRSVEYLTQLRSGLTVVLVALICQVGILVLAILASIAVAALAPGSSMAVHRLVQFLQVAASLASLYGWWRITAPDPGRVGGGLDVRPRQVIRVAVIVQVGASIASVALEPFGNFNTLDIGDPLAVAAIAASIVSLGAWVVQFFAGMQYVRWFARRVPDAKLEADAKRFMWLGPLLYVLLFCIAIGPIVALVLYWIMLNTLRKHVSSMVVAGEMAAG